MSREKLDEIDKLIIAYTGYDLIVKHGYSLTKASDSLSVARSTLRRYMKMYIDESDKLANLELAIAQHTHNYHEPEDIVHQAKEMSETKCENSSDSFSESLKDAAANITPKRRKNKSFLTNLFKRR